MNKVKEKTVLNSSITTLPSKQNLSISDSKRFVRKRDKSNESFGFHRTPKNSSHKPNFKLNEQSSPKLTETFKSTSFIRNRDFLNALRNEVKEEELGSVSYKEIKEQGKLKINDNFRQKFQNILKKGEKEVQENYQEQLQMKNKEIVLLQDENARMRMKIEEYKKIQKSQQKLAHQNKEINSKLKNYQYKNIKLENENYRLLSKISFLNEQCEKIQNQLDNIIEKYEQLLNEKDIFMQYYEQYIETNVPQNYQTIQTYKEMSLQKQIQWLKEQNQQSTTQREQTLQIQIQKLRYALSSQVEKVRSFEILNVILQKKLDQNQIIFLQNLRLKDDIDHLKAKLQTLQGENQQLRKTNLSIRRNMWEKLDSKIQKKRLKASESEESLTFSNCSD